MGLTTLIGLWMVVQEPAKTQGPDSATERTTIAYIYDRNECEMYAAQEEDWKCVKRENIEQAIAKKNARIMQGQ